LFDVFRSCKNRRKLIRCVIVDEAQFLTKQQVWQLTWIADLYDIPVICYGLRTNFMGKLFEGSEALLTYADTIEEIKTICRCGKKATMVLRMSGKKVVKDGAEVMIGGNESYVSVCRKHWKEAMDSTIGEYHDTKR